MDEHLCLWYGGCGSAIFARVQRRSEEGGTD